MPEQPTLFPVESAGVTLTERQAFAYAFLKRHAQDGVTSDEMGAALHARRDKHDEGERCQWCSSEGKSVLGSLRRKGLAKRRRAGGWVALGASEVSDGSYDPETAEIPF